jgi:hypothetical protein
MTSAQIRLFSAVAATSRLSSYGVTVDFNGVTISMVCFPLSELELAAGGYERGGAMKALVKGSTIPDEHDRLGIDGKTWVVKEKRTNIAEVETALTLQAIAAVRDL